MSDRQQLLTYIQDQIARAELRARAYTIDPAGKQYPTRNAYVRLNKYVMDFVHKKTTSERWLAISGLRGTGKTTLLAQLYCELRIPKERKLFISADHIVQLLSSSINEVLDVYEDVLGTALLSAREPIFLFVDEVQYDPKWAIALKSVYDRAKNVFILTTGSSALEINSNPDTARRVICETLLPMTFPEYEKIRNGIFEQRGLGGRLRDGILHANNSNDVFQLFRRESTSITSYWANVDSHDVRPYLEYGTLPFMAALKSQALAFDQLERSIDRVLGSDVLKIGQFSADVMARIPQVLYAVADSDVTSLNSLSKSLEMPRPTLTRVFEALEKAEILFKLEANKPHSAQIRQPDKYLFTTPAIRAMYFSLTGSMQSDGHIMGRLMEDLVGMYLRRIFGERSLTTSINYGSGAGEADFVIRHRGKTYVIEVGFGAKTTRQVAQTSHVPENRIGIVVANETLRMDDRRDVVTVPIREFLLL